MAPTQRYRVLCLPGYGTTGEMLLGKMAKLNKVLDEDFELVGMDPPMLFGHPTTTFGTSKVSPVIEEQYCGWWPRHYTHTFENDYDSFENVLWAVREYVERTGPYDAILGFSQGGNVLAHLLPLFEKPWLHPAFTSPAPWRARASITSLASEPASTLASRRSSLLSDTPPVSPMGSDFCSATTSRRSSIGEDDIWPIKPFKCAIFVGAYGPGDPITNPWFDTPVKCPTLHIIGRNDAWIHPQYQIDTAARFADTTTLWHVGGHIMPQSKEHHTAIHDFLLTHCRA
ncbi:hypothetical protein JCM3774_002523 [Rhodotorula dairenensis]